MQGTQVIQFCFQRSRLSISRFIRETVFKVAKVPSHQTPSRQIAIAFLLKLVTTSLLEIPFTLEYRPVKSMGENRDEWNSLVFSDESWFSLRQYDGRIGVYRWPGDRNNGKSSFIVNVEKGTITYFQGTYPRSSFTASSVTMYAFLNLHQRKSAFMAPRLGIFNHRTHTYRILSNHTS